MSKNTFNYDSNKHPDKKPGDEQDKNTQHDSPAIDGTQNKPEQVDNHNNAEIQHKQSPDIDGKEQDDLASSVDASISTQKQEGPPAFNQGLEENDATVSVTLPAIPAIAKKQRKQEIHKEPEENKNKISAPLVPNTPVVNMPEIPETPAIEPGEIQPTAETAPLEEQDAIVASEQRELLSNNSIPNGGRGATNDNNSSYEEQSDQPIKQENSDATAKSADSSIRPNEQKNTHSKHSNGNSTHRNYNKNNSDYGSSGTISDISHVGNTTYVAGNDHGKANTNTKKKTPQKQKNILPNSQEEFALRRTRVNRVLMRRRRTERTGTNVLSRLLIMLVALLAVLVVIVSGTAGGAYAYYRSQLPLLDSIAQHSLFQTTHIYDRNGKLLYDLYDKQEGKGRRTYVNYQDISPLLISATVSAEDHTFWNNTGVDYLGIARAAFTNIQSNGVVEGGSTITQQLVKNEFFQGQPRSVQVKGQEAVLATGLTQQYPKWKIMEMYLNTVFYGDDNYGVEAAAQDFFNLKSQCDPNQSNCKPAVAQLDLAQASLLAGLPQSPTSYNPVYYKQAAITRQQQVLSSMVKLGFITPQQSQDAQKETQAMNFKTYAETHQPQAPHFVNYVIDHVLIPEFGAEALHDGGFNIYTTLDLDLEQKAEQLLYHHLYEQVTDQRYSAWYNDPGPLNLTKNVNNGAIVVINPKNGEILAMDGSASTDPAKFTPEMQGDYNAAISPRQPGSSFKPFVYATAFEMGWYPAMIVNDHKTYYPDAQKPYTPQNADDNFHSGLGYPMTIRNALASSFNIPAIDTIEYAGVKNVVNMAGRLGLTEVTSNPANWVPSMAIGSIPISPLDMTDAYSTFANNGERVPPVSILKVTDNQNRLIYQYDEAHPQEIQVMRPEVAFLVNSILSDKEARYHEFAPGNPMEMNRPAAAKTGTIDMYRDNWTMGYTPDLATGVWVGNSNNVPMHDILGVTGAAPVWNELMTYALQRYNMPPDNFAMPSDVHQARVSSLTGLAPRAGEPTVTDWFIDGSVPSIQGVEAPLPLPSPGPTPAPGEQNDQNLQNLPPGRLQGHHHDTNQDNTNSFSNDNTNTINGGNEATPIGTITAGSTINNP